MFELHHNKSRGRPKEAITQKAFITLTQFKVRIKKLGYGVTSFASYSGIARTTIEGWKPNREDKKMGITNKVPLYAIRLVEALEKQNELKEKESERIFQIKKLYEINIKYLNEIKTI